MEGSVNKFISHEYRLKEFNKMVENISVTGRISPELARKYTQQALINYNKKKDILTLFTASPSTRLNEIKKIESNIRDFLRPIIFSEKKLNRTMEIIENSLETMYRLF
ncbi:MAG: hypothetical protein ACTSWX_15740 [Promethearchaeota archaeon]